jgi:adenylate cyclase
MDRRLSAILVVDMVDYTRQMAQDESRTIELIRELRHVYVEPLVLKAGGEILKRMGDGWIIAFASIQQLVECAIEFQEKLAGHGGIHLRTAGHIGEIVFDEDDFYGSGINLAHRLQAEAPPGGLLISADLYRQMSAELAALFDDAGSFQLKNIPHVVNAYQWRPQNRAKERAADELPTISIERFEHAPDTSDTRSVVADIKHQLLGALSQRTGVRILDSEGREHEPSHYRLRGTLRMASARGRLNLSLLLGDSGAVVWARHYEASTDDIFRFADEVVERANADLRIQINAFDGNRFAALSDEELSISELRTRAANFFHEGSFSGHEKVRALMERAIVLNPEDAMSLAMHAEAVLVLHAASHCDPAPETLEVLDRHLNKAVENAPRSDYVRFVSAVFDLWGRHDTEEAKKDIDRCLSINPSYPWGLFALGLYHSAKSEFDLAVKALDKAILLSDSDPLLPQILFVSSEILFCAGQYQRALATPPGCRAACRAGRECCHRAGRNG